MSKKKPAGDITDLAADSIPELTAGDLVAKGLQAGAELTAELIDTIGVTPTEDTDQDLIERAVSSIDISDESGRKKPATLKLPEGSTQVFVLRHNATGAYLQYNAVSGASPDFTVLRVERDLLPKLNLIA